MTSSSSNSTMALASNTTAPAHRSTRCGQDKERGQGYRLAVTSRLAVIAVAGLISQARWAAAAGGEPEGFKRLAPYKRAAIDKPTFVAAADAKIPDHAWVMGVQLVDETRAYSLDLLNGFEVVNDKSKYVDFIVVWSPMANTAVVYERKYRNLTLRFEASGGMVNGSPILRDKETRSYWSLMSGEAVSGPLKGTKLKQLPIGQRVLWREWFAAHPETRVLSVAGTTHWYSGAYHGYFASDGGFAGLAAEDRRLATKAPVFAFRLHVGAQAVPHEAIEGGRVFEIEGSTVFFYREPKSAPFKSTVAFAGTRFKQVKGVWFETRSKCRFSPSKGIFEGVHCPRLLEGFDTFWYSWSLNNPKTALLW